MGTEPDSYAEGIIEVCKSYAESPVAFISGISGADLKKRISRIINRRCGDNLTRGKKLALTVISVVAMIAPLAIGLVNAPLLRAQSSATDWEKAAGGKMSFEVASVKRNTSGHVAGSLPTVPLTDGDDYTPDGGLFSAADIPLAAYIDFAYKLPPVQRQSVQTQMPNWAKANTFDVQARAAAGTDPTKDQMRLMMQSLLADRFKLAVHIDAREGPVFGLVLVKPGQAGPQLRPYSGHPPCGDTLGGPGSPVSFDAQGFPMTCGTLMGRMAGPGEPARLGSRNITMMYFASYLPAFGRLDRPVLDQTGLSGKFDITLAWIPEQPPGGAQLPPGVQAKPQPEASGPTFLEALKDQLGLKLVPTTGPVDTLVIDHIEEPTPN